ncbi:MAG: holin family protein [Alphaproteobacteria bacterium]
MSLWRAVTGIFKPAKELVEVFKPNAEKQAERKHEERMELSKQDMASLEQFAAEFKSKRTATAWDSFVDGLNRLPRPLITLGILGLFVLAPADPLRFLEIARAYQIMPDGFWALLSIIIAFYFGGRMQVTKQQMTIAGGALDAAKEIVKVRKAIRELAEEDEPVTEKVFREAEKAAEAGQRSNRVIAAWLKRRQERAPETIAP